MDGGRILKEREAVVRRARRQRYAEGHRQVAHEEEQHKAMFIAQDGRSPGTRRGRPTRNVKKGDRGQTDAKPDAVAAAIPERRRRADPARPPPRSHLRTRAPNGVLPISAGGRHRAARPFAMGERAEHGARGAGVSATAHRQRAATALGGQSSRSTSTRSSATRAQASARCSSRTICRRRRRTSSRRSAAPARTRPINEVGRSRRTPPPRMPPRPPPRRETRRAPPSGRERSLRGDAPGDDLRLDDRPAAPTSSIFGVELVSDKVARRGDPRYLAAEDLEPRK